MIISGTAILGSGFQYGKQVLHGGDFLVMDQDVGIIQNRFHFLGICDKVGS
jgi:hypothetical protein